MDEVLLEHIEDGVLTLTMNRPDRLNALTWEMCDRMQRALVAAAADPAVGAIVLTGAGRAFCAGGDVKAMAETPQAADRYEERVADLRRAHGSARGCCTRSPKPTIAMLRGPAAGAGLSLALACDLRIAGEEARFTTAFAKVGLSGDFGGHYFLTQLVGTAKARELYIAVAGHRRKDGAGAGPRGQGSAGRRARGRDAQRSPARSPRGRASRSATSSRTSTSPRAAPACRT